ncbi:hypothetical protein R3Q06_32525 [Rhodococcus erythropolis]|nr:hypothetical protein [Rhodococcus erythropolis]MDV6278192.1 hypothetical protein [Rhodococcus erythropolis]
MFLDSSEAAHWSKIDLGSDPIFKTRNGKRVQVLERFTLIE